MKRLHLFKSGKQRAMSGLEVNFGEAILKGIAATYDPALHEAPIVVGHPTTDSPAFGWVADVSATGSDLFGTPKQVDPAFAEAVGAGRYKKLSASFYLPESPNHPIRKNGGEPAFPYLRHVGFLGAQPPAVPGLAPIEFGDDTEGVETVEFADADFTESSPGGIRGFLRLLAEGLNLVAQGTSPDDLQVPLAPISSFSEPEQKARPDSEPETEPSMTDEKKTAEFAEREANLDQREAAVKAAEEAQAQADAKRLHQENVDFAEALANDGARILPRHIPVVAGVLSALKGSETTVEFGESDEKLAPADALKQMLSELPQNVEFAEVSKAEESTASGTVEFSAPEGYAVPKDRAALLGKARAYQAEHNVDFATACKAVGVK